ncbi:hypothetical protein CW751_15210, partial [Brumimicrobium salinarum]
WNFGDGNASTLENPTHTYGSEGVFDVTLIVESNHGCRDTVENPSTVYPLPQVDFSPSDVCLSATTTFTNESNISNAFTNNSLTSWDWDFGDGNSSNQENPTHTYANSGDYITNLSVTSNHNCVATINKTVTVHP